MPSIRDVITVYGLWIHEHQVYGFDLIFFDILLGCTITSGQGYGEQGERGIN